MEIGKNIKAKNFSVMPLKDTNVLINHENSITISSDKFKSRRFAEPVLPKLPAIAAIIADISTDLQEIVHNPRLLNNYEKIKPVSIANYKTAIGEKLSSLHNELKAKEAITTGQLNDIKNFDPLKQDMFLTSLKEMESLKAGKTNAADYMLNIMNHAADLSGNDGGKFIDLVGEMFSDVPIPLDFFRRILGGGPHSGGNVLEPMLDRVVESQQGSHGFNPNMTDDIDKNNTLTHHVGEFLQVGYNRGNFLGKFAAGVIDSGYIGIIQSQKNEGDVRSGYFSTMIGSALKKNKISPHDAVKLFRWAYAENHGGKQAPPFGSRETEGKYMNWSDYNIKKWINAYNKAFPNAQI